MMQICTALHFMTSRWRRRGLNSFCYSLFNCVAWMVNSSEFKLGSAGVATLFVLGTGSFFSGDVLFVRVFCCGPSETELSILHPCIFDTVYITTSRLDVRYRVTQDIAAIHIHMVVLDRFWMIDRCYRILRFHATQITSIPTAVTGHHKKPQVFLAGYLGSGRQTYIQ